ncbi:MAG: phosphoribosylaminoimidazolesuccinocarboxamide synthase [Microbacteriaceae bacterium]|nr:phosphoribosylaminoimidazolesuccinocarboxamide synthase [Microbacteriaceae bacterium]
MSEFEDWEPVYSGKVRELYRSKSRPGQLLVVATDRVSAFDFILEPDIPGKGAVLNSLSLWWFGELKSIPNHLVENPDPGAIPAHLAGRSMLVRELEMFPIECVVRGYLAGSAWAEYEQAGRVGEFDLPAGLTFGDRLPQPIYTPAFKAPLGEHDENISFARTVELVGSDEAEKLRELSLQIYSTAAGIAEGRGLILADTKFEFGRSADGVIRLADEVLTSDSSRYWDRQQWESGNRSDSFDKQLIRNWLKANWSGEGKPPGLPQEIVELTTSRYRELYSRLTGLGLNQGAASD